jgi:hypothetical protein
MAGEIMLDLQGRRGIIRRRAQGVFLSRTVRLGHLNQYEVNYG